MITEILMLATMTICFSALVIINCRAILNRDKRLKKWSCTELVNGKIFWEQALIQDGGKTN